MADVTLGLSYEAAEALHVDLLKDLYKIMNHPANRNAAHPVDRKHNRKIRKAAARLLEYYEAEVPDDEASR